MLNTLIISSKEFNSNWRVCVHYGELRTFIGYSNLVDLLDCYCERCFNRLLSCKLDKCVQKPFRGCVMYFYRK